MADPGPAGRVAELLKGFPVVVTQSVAWGDMDAFGHVNNVVYFRYFENARIEYLRRLGWSDLAACGNVGPILASISARFRRPLHYPDTISIGARVSEVGEDRFTFDHRVVSHAQAEVTTEGPGLVVCYDYTAMKKAPLPAGIRDLITKMEVQGERGA